MLLVGTPALAGEHPDLARPEDERETWPSDARAGDARVQAHVPRQAFEQLPRAERIRLVREECYALALQRGTLQRKQLPISDAERHDWLRGYWNQLMAKDRDAAMPAFLPA